MQFTFREHAYRTITPMAKRILPVVLLFFGTPAWAQDSEPVVYPHLVVGGGFQVVVLTTNPTDQPWEGSMRLPDFGSGSGRSWMHNGVDRTGSDATPLILEPQATMRHVLAAPAGSPIWSGVFLIEGGNGSSAADLAVTFFLEYWLEDELVDMVGVAASPSAHRVSIPVEVSPSTSTNTGIAIRRPREVGTAGDEPEPFQMTLFDEVGESLGTIEVEDEGARFASEFFPDHAGQGEFIGSILCESHDPFHLVALRQRLLEGGRFHLTGVPAAILPGTPPEKPAISATARYRVRFNATWSARTHPNDFPSTPHFSGLIGGTHNDDVNFWGPGQNATPGIKSMAETGGQSLLAGEVRDAIQLGTAEHVLRGGGIGRSPGSTSLQFEISQDFPLVTLVSMIAPSPDWFVGVHGLSLLEAGDWLEERTLELFPYDAGTDSGVTFNSPNARTAPPEPIRRITEPPLGDGRTASPLGTFTFTRVEE